MDGFGNRAGLNQREKQGEKRQVSFMDKPVDERLVTDPRPDMAEDHQFWGDLLYLAAQKNEMLAGILHGFRCKGTRLRRNSDGDYVLRPDIDSDGKRAWRSQAEYEEARDQWLAGYRAEIIELLKELEKISESERAV